VRYTYYFANWIERPGEEGLYPCFGKGIGFLLLAQPSDHADWGLFRCDLSNSNIPFGAEKVPDGLVTLIDSGESYPPALAIARDEIEDRFKKREVSKEEFVYCYSQILLDHLKGQAMSGYIIAQAKKDETGYLEKGAFYWIVGYYPQNQSVEWVSRDYNIYVNRLSDFALDINLLKQITKELTHSKD
jgi:hypothetical protein